MGSVDPADSGDPVDAVDQAAGIAFPADDGGRRSSTALGRAVVADALRSVDPAAALLVEREKDWRGGYLKHFHRLVEAGLASREAAVAIASDGLASLHKRMRVCLPGGTEIGIDGLFATAPSEPFETATATGSGKPEREFTLPFRGERLRRDTLRYRLDHWVTDGVLEPSAAQAVRDVAENPDWLDLSDQTIVVLGAGAEMGPLRAVLRWGGTVAAVDLPRPSVWAKLLEVVEGSAGRLLAPVPAAAGATSGRPITDVAGADLLDHLPAVADWLGRLDGRLVLGNYVYADGATNLRLSVGVDALTTHLSGLRPDAVLAFLATPTDVFAVPAEAVAQSNARYGASTRTAKIARRTLRTVSGGRLLRPSYPRGAEVGICDSLVSQQGPNYALAKRLQRWRATVAREAGTAVSLNVAPPTRTKSVIKNRALAAAYAGAHRFGVEVFDPATSNTLMAALLVHDLRTAPPAHPLPWQDEAFCAVHGGLWRGPYDPRSALGLAAMLGIGAART